MVYIASVVNGIYTVWCLIEATYYDISDTGKYYIRKGCVLEYKDIIIIIKQAPLSSALGTRAENNDIPLCQFEMPIHIWRALTNYCINHHVCTVAEMCFCQRSPFLNVVSHFQKTNNIDCDAIRASCTIMLCSALRYIILYM